MRLRSVAATRLPDWLSGRRLGGRGGGVARASRCRGCWCFRRCAAGRAIALRDQRPAMSGVLRMRAMPPPEAELPETRERRCPACASEAITPANHVVAEDGLIKVEHRCEACGSGFGSCGSRSPKRSVAQVTRARIIARPPGPSARLRLPAACAQPPCRSVTTARVILPAPRRRAGRRPCGRRRRRSCRSR